MISKLLNFFVLRKIWKLQFLTKKYDENRWFFIYLRKVTGFAQKTCLQKILVYNFFYVEKYLNGMGFTNSPAVNIILSLKTMADLRKVTEFPQYICT